MSFDYILDDNGDKVMVGDTVINYYNIADGIDSRGDIAEEVIIKNKRQLFFIGEYENSRGEVCVKKLSGMRGTSLIVNIFKKYKGEGRII